MPPVDTKSLRFPGSDPGGCVTSAKKVTVAFEMGTDGVPISTTAAFCVTGALLAAVSVTVTLCPGKKNGGWNDAVVPGGNPETEGVMSKSTLVVEFTSDWNWRLPEPPIGTPISLLKGDEKEILGGALELTVKLKSPFAVAPPAVPLRTTSYGPVARVPAA